jgi:hypothetical protein
MEQGFELLPPIGEPAKRALSSGDKTGQNPPPRSAQQPPVERAKLAKP